MDLNESVSGNIFSNNNNVAREVSARGSCFTIYTMWNVSLVGDTYTTNSQAWWGILWAATPLKYKINF